MNIKNKSMRTIIAGSRDIASQDLVFDAIESAMEEGFDISEVVSGTADGVDSIGEKWADEKDIAVERFPYENYLEGNPNDIAPLIRNAKMAEYADQAIIVWDGESKGTKDMISKAQEKDLDLYVERTDMRNIDEF